jgi:hypothetical protein
MQRMFQQARNTLYNGESEAGTLFTFTGRVVHLKKLLEDCLLSIFGNADTCVTDTTPRATTGHMRVP